MRFFYSLFTIAFYCLFSLFPNDGIAQCATYTTFSTPSNYYAAGYYPQSIAAGDVNGDGKPDLALANNGDNTVSVLINQGSGTFAAAGNYATGHYPSSVVMGDVNGDGKADLAVTNPGDNNVSVFINHGDGSFAQAINYVTGSWPYSISLGDINGDGKADMAVANYNSNNVSVFLNNGDGTFAPAVNYATGTGPGSVSMGDMNGDGITDMAIANSGNNTVSVFISLGNGTFSQAADLMTASSPTAVTVGDINGDGKADLAVTNAGVYISNGNGTFNAASNQTTPSLTGAVAIGDVTQDGKADIVVGTGGGFAVSINNGDGTFAPPANYATESGLACFAISDVNSDGKADLIAVNTFYEPFPIDDSYSTVSVLFGTCAVITPTVTTSSAGIITAATAQSGGNVTSDGNAPVTERGLVYSTVSSPTISNVKIISGSGTGAFTTTLTGLYANTTYHVRAYATNSQGTGYGNEVTLTTAEACSATQIGAAVNYPVGTGPEGVDVGDINGDGIADMAVANHYSNNVSVFINKGDGTFVAAVTYATPASPYSVAIRDLNGDGKKDLAVTNSNVATVSVLLNKGDGSFAPAINYATGYEPMSVAIGDLNGDGKADMAVVNYGSSNISILLNKGDGTFAPPVNYANGTYSYSVALGDINGDGKTDVVATNGGSENISIFLNKGDGTFNTAVSVGNNVSSLSVAVGDVNGDGKMDLVSTGSIGSYNYVILVFLNNGNGTFATPVTYANGAYPEAVALGDVNGDGKSDIAVANGGGDASVFLNSGNGNFAPAVKYATGSSSFSIAIGDINGDGEADLAVANYGDNTVSVLLGKCIPAPTVTTSNMSTITAATAQSGGNVTSDGNATITERGLVYSTVSSPTISNTKVINGSGTGSFIATLTSLYANTTYYVRAYATNSGGTGYGNEVKFTTAAACPSTQIAAAVNYTTQNNPESVAVGDLNGDGKADMVEANTGSSSINVFMNNGEGTFTTAAAYTSKALPVSVAIGDLNGDGKADLVTANVGNNTVSVFMNNGDGTYAVAVTYATGSQPTSVAVGDINGDGKIDLAVTNNGSNTVSVFLNKGDGTFAAAASYTTGSYPFSIAVGDLNGDGKIDMAVANEGDGTASVFINNGDGTFAAAVNYTTGYDTRSVAIGDINGDGKADMAAANEGDSNVSVLINNGDGTFATAVNYTTGYQYGPYSVAIGDINGDGKADMAVTNFYNNTVSVFLNKGDGTFAPPINYATGNNSNPVSVSMGDVNGDGIGDIAVANYNSNNVSVLLSECSAATTTTIAGSANPSCAGSIVTFKATVLQGGTQTPVTAGGITFTQGNTVLADSIPVNASGQASLSTDTLVAGSHTIVATYKAAAGFSTSSASVTQVVNPRPTGSITGGGTYCSGANTTNSLTITATGSGTINGTLSDGTPFSGTAPITVDVAPTATTTFTITTLSDATCSAQASDLSGSATVTINATPATPVVTVANNCGSSTLSTTATGSLLWSTNATTPSITVTNGGTYTVTQTVNGCTSASGGGNAAINPDKVWYLDADGDGYYTGTGKTQCVSPGEGYKYSGLLAGNDCNDADASVWQSTVLYIDHDGDGYNAGTQTMCYGAAVPKGYSLTTNGSDCNDNDNSVWRSGTFYRDQDGDGYTVSTGATLCYGLNTPTGYQTTQSSATDCNDQNAAVHPGAIEICGNGIDDNCDGQIDEGCNSKLLVSISDATIYESAGMVSLSISLSKKSTQPVTVSYKTVDGTAVSKANKNNPIDFTAKSGTVVIPAGQLSAAISIVIAKDNVQEPTEQFTVQLSKPLNAAIDKGVGTVTILDGAIVQAKALEEPGNVEETNSRLTLHPNPSNGRFIINLHLSNNNNTKAKIELVNMLGQTVYTDNGSIANGKLQQTVSMPSLAAHGMYIVRIIADNEVYQQKLIYTK